MQQINNDIVLARMFGMSMANAEDAIYIAECTKEIRDIGAFIGFCDDKKEGIIARASEKLRILSKKFKELEEAERLKDDRFKGEAWTAAIIKKVDQVRIILKNARSNGKDVGFRNMTEDGKPAFTVKQLLALATIGSTDYIIHRCETGELQKDLMRSYMDKFKKKAAYKSLGANAQKVMLLASSVKTA